MVGSADQPSHMLSPASTISCGDELVSDDSQYASYMDNESPNNTDEDTRRIRNARYAEIRRNGANNVPRRPTRRPNPKVHNRNALMARENRQKKKVHVEMLERDVNELRNENAALRKQLRKRTKTVNLLRDERLYLKSIIANKTSIMSMLKTIQGNRLPITSSAMGYVITDQMPTPSQAIQQHPQMQMSADSKDGILQNHEGRTNITTNANTASNTNNSNITINSRTTVCSNNVNNRCTVYNQLDDFFQVRSSSSWASSSSTSTTPVECMSPISDMCMPDLPWGESIIHDAGDLDAAADPLSNGCKLSWLSGDVSMDEEDSDDEDDEDENVDEVKFNVHSDGDGGDHVDDDDDDVDTDDDDDSDGDSGPLHRSKVSHEHNYSHNHINEQSTHHRRRTTATYSTAEHLHRGGKVRPTAYATGAPSTGHGPGICLHLSGGRVSLEFCASCHRHAQNAWDEE